jgi:hypothetical protein
MNQIPSSGSSSEPSAALVRTGSKGGFALDHALIAQIILVAVFIGTLFVLDGLSRNYATLTLQVGSQQRMFQGEVVPGMTLLDALNASALAGRIPLQFLIDQNNKTKIIVLGSFGEVVDEKIQFFVNQRLIPLEAIHTVPINARDRIDVTIDQ